MRNGRSTTKEKVGKEDTQQVKLQVKTAGETQCRQLSNALWLKKERRTSVHVKIASCHRRS